MGFQIDRYTPHGYLHIPTHTRRLKPLGVVRSWDAGFRWHAPAYAGSYGGRRETYRAGVRVALEGVLELPAFDEATSPYHSGAVMVMDVRVRDSRARLSWHLVGEHALRGIAEREGVTGSSGTARDALGSTANAGLALHVAYRRMLSASGEWGESGLVGRIEDGLLVLQAFEDGEAFVLWTSAGATDIGITHAGVVIGSWAAARAPGLPDVGFTTVLGERGEEVELHAILGLPTVPRVEWILARGRTVADARRNLDAARTDAGAEQARLLATDEAFWAVAPCLTGDWPDHWRRGLVYDLETIRMMVRPPAGIYRHVWDGMQVQAPRVVLAETAMDALVLGWADPTLAQELLLGTLLDGPEPNVPCSREDGSYNMVAADGTVCGTAPEWGYPVWVAAQLDAMSPDTAWLERIYPPLAAFVEWWLVHRRDPDGSLWYACSWESGQDMSPRFGDQPLGGGHPTRHIRPVDLHAAMAQACGIMAGFAHQLSRDDDTNAWRERESDLAQRTAALWDGKRWADVDATTGSPTLVDDVMLTAPLALGVASADQAAVVARGPWLDGFADADRLVWPMFAWTAVESLRAAGRQDQASEVIRGIVDRVYGRWDAPVADPDRALPGIAAEYWPVEGGGGGEGYGWGAFGVHLLLSSLVGVRPAPGGGMEIRPCLPVSWRTAGRAFGLEIVVRGRRRSIVIHPLGSEDLELTLDGQRHRMRWGDRVVLAAGRTAA